MTKPTKRRNAPLDRTARPRDSALVIATEIQKLAADFEVASKEDLSVQSNTGDDAEMMAAFNRASELAEKILGLPTSTDLSITRLRSTRPVSGPNALPLARTPRSTNAAESKGS